MRTEIETKPVGDEDVPKVDDSLAVGEDVEFQRRWWRFETIVWIVFVLILIADLTGMLGRGPLANRQRHTDDNTLTVKYEGLERANTSSIMTILPGPDSLKNGKFHLFVSDSVVKELGAQRVIPQPEASVLGSGGITYTFSAAALPMVVQIELKPSFIGHHQFTVGVPGGQPIGAGVFVFP